MGQSVMLLWIMGDALDKLELSRSVVYSSRVFLLLLRRWCAMSDLFDCAFCPMLAFSGT